MRGRLTLAAVLLAAAVGLAGCYYGPGGYDGGYDGGYGYGYAPGYYAYSPPSVSFFFGGNFWRHHHRHGYHGHW